jgi:hypothetical protein
MIGKSSAFPLHQSLAVVGDDAPVSLAMQLLRGSLFI